MTASRAYNMQRLVAVGIPEVLQPCFGRAHDIFKIVYTLGLLSDRLHIYISAGCVVSC